MNDLEGLAVDEGSSSILDQWSCTHNDSFNNVSTPTWTGDNGFLEPLGPKLQVKIM